MVALKHVEQGTQEPVRAQHPSRRYLYDGDPPLVRDRLDRLRPDVGFGGHQCSRIVWSVRVADPHRDPRVHRRLNGARVEYLGAEIGQLGRFGVRQPRDRPRGAHDSRVGREHSAHVGISRPASPECGGHAIRGGGHVPSEHRDLADVEQRTKLSLGPRSGLREQRNGGWMLVRRDDASPSIDVTGPEAACLEHRRAERGSEMLTMGGELVVQCRAGIGAPRDTPRQVRERVD